MSEAATTTRGSRQRDSQGYHCHVVGSSDDCDDDVTVALVSRLLHRVVVVTVAKRRGGKARDGMAGATTRQSRRCDCRVVVAVVVLMLWTRIGRDISTRTV